MGWKTSRSTAAAVAGRVAEALELGYEAIDPAGAELVSTDGGEETEPWS
jgi:hypothetical protein